VFVQQNNIYYGIYISFVLCEMSRTSKPKCKLGVRVRQCFLEYRIPLLSLVRCSEVTWGTLRMEAGKRNR
jgi:hypothetical protein